MHDGPRARDGHRCPGREELGNQASGQPRASLAISPTECLATKGRAIKANRSDSPGARLIEKQNPRIQHVSRLPEVSHHAASPPRSEPGEPSPQPSSHCSGHLCVASSPPVPNCIPVPRTHSPHSLPPRLGLHPRLTHTHSFSPSAFLPPPPPSFGHSGAQKPASLGSKWTQREASGSPRPSPPRARAPWPGILSPVPERASRASCPVSPVLASGAPRSAGLGESAQTIGGSGAQGPHPAVLRTDVPPGGTWRQGGRGRVVGGRL